MLKKQHLIIAFTIFRQQIKKKKSRNCAYRLAGTTVITSDANFTVRTRQFGIKTLSYLNNSFLIKIPDYI